jgi:hypothetical protein
MHLALLGLLPFRSYYARRAAASLAPANSWPTLTFYTQQHNSSQESNGSTVAAYNRQHDTTRLEEQAHGRANGAAPYAMACGNEKPW